MDVEFVPVSGGKKDFSNINDGDVVILPAFGATLEEMQFLDKKDVQVVDTTCPWVSKVWNTVDKHTKVRGFFCCCRVKVDGRCLTDFDCPHLLRLRSQP